MGVRDGEVSELGGQSGTKIYLVLILLSSVGFRVTEMGHRDPSLQKGTVVTLDPKEGRSYLH